MKFLAGVLMAASLSAQPIPISPADADEHRIIMERFSSTQPSDLAWGAHLAANYRQPSFIPRIVELLQHTDWAVRTVAFDALIRLRADLSSEALAPLVKDYFDEVVILQARDVKKNGPFLNTLLNGTLEIWQWVALNGILSQSPPPGYAARLVREWHPRFEITVWNKLQMGLVSGASTCGDSGTGYHPGFPPVVFYRLGRGETRLAGGPHPVYYEVVAAPSRCYSVVSRDEYTLDYLRVLTGVSEARPRGTHL